MALRQTKKISELPALSPASLDTTYVVGISGSTTYKISINNLTSSLDTTFATDLVTNALSSSLDTKLSTSSFNSYTASISTASLVTSISNLNTFTASVTTASIVTSISNLNTFTASVSTASLVTSISNLNTFTASQSTSSLVNRLTTIESVSGSWITESETGSFLTSLNGAISSSFQLTSSFDTRYTLSGSILTSFSTSVDSRLDNLEAEISSSVSYIFVKHDGVQTSPATGQFYKPNYGTIGNIPYDVNTGYFTLYTGKTYNLKAVYSFYDDNSNESTHGWYDVTNNVFLNSYGNYPQPTAELMITPSTNIQIGVKSSKIGNPTIDNSTSYILIQELGIGIVEGITGSTDYTQITNKPTLISSSAQITAFGFVSGSYETTGRGIISSSANLVTTSSFNSYTASISTASLVTSISNLNSATSSYLTSLSGAISSSSQLTSAFPSKTTGTWSVPANASTQSFTVEAGASYTMWVNGNIPNGIITWNATVTTANTNVPVVGSQHGWYYTVGNALVLTSMPDQITGTNGSIVTTPTSYAPNTSNVFKFGITNNSGTTQTINYGYIKLS